MKQKILTISILLFLILGISSAVYFKSIFQTPNQQACSDLEGITKELSNLRPELKMTQTPNPKDSPEDLMIMFDRKKPLQAHTLEFHSRGDTNEDDISKLLPTYLNNIEPKLLNLGFEKEFEYKAFNYNFYQYKKGDNRVVFNIPTSNLEDKDDYTYTGVNIACGKVNPEYLKIYEGLTPFFGELDRMDIWKIKDNALIVSIGLKGALVGYSYYFDISKEKFELIYGTSEAVRCDELRKRKIGKGMDCLEFDKVSKEYKYSVLEN